MPKMPPKVPVEESFAFLFTCIDATGVKPDFKVVGDLIGLAPAAARMRYSRLRKAVESGDYKNAILTQPQPTSRRMLEIAASDTEFGSTYGEPSPHRVRIDDWVSHDGEDDDCSDDNAKNPPINTGSDSRKRKAQSPSAETSTSSLFFPASSPRYRGSFPHDARAEQSTKLGHDGYSTRPGYPEPSAGHQSKVPRHESATSTSSLPYCITRDWKPTTNVAPSTANQTVAHDRHPPSSRNPYDPPSLQIPQLQFPHFPSTATLPQTVAPPNSAFSGLPRNPPFPFEIQSPSIGRRTGGDPYPELSNAKGHESSTFSTPVRNQHLNPHEGLGSILNDFEPARRWGDRPQYSSKCPLSQIPLKTLTANLDPQLRASFSTSRPYSPPAISPSEPPSTRDSISRTASFTTGPASGIQPPSGRGTPLQPEIQGREAAEILRNMNENQESTEGARQAKQDTSEVKQES